jgi:Putative phage metallopeptidase
MPTFSRCSDTIDKLAYDLCCKFHEPLIAAKVKIDYVFAYGDTDAKGRTMNDALTKNGRKALGICRKIPLKDRALGRGDAEISLDADHWKLCSESEQAALLDHELQHIAVQTDKGGYVQRDDLGRPKIRLRQHDVEVGWFNVVAQRHGAASVERIQAKSIMEIDGQFYWPDLVPLQDSVTISTDKESVTMPMGRFSKIAREVTERANAT